MDVSTLKREWIRKWMPGANVDSNCFFCGYQIQQVGQNDYSCLSCPGKLVNSQFDCRNRTYHYQDEPKKFYQKLLVLDAKRRQSNGQGINQTASPHIKGTGRTPVAIRHTADVVRVVPSSVEGVT